MGVDLEAQAEPLPGEAFEELPAVDGHDPLPGRDDVLRVVEGKEIDVVPQTGRRPAGVVQPVAQGGQGVVVSDLGPAAPAGRTALPGPEPVREAGDRPAAFAALQMELGLGAHGFFIPS